MLPRGPRTPGIWQIYRFLVAPREDTEEGRRLYGDAIRFQSPVGNGVFVLSPELAREVFAADPDTFETSSTTRSVFGAHAVLATSGPTHRRQRKLLNPRFHSSRVKGYLETIQRVVRESLRVFDDAARTGDITVVREVAQRVTLEVIIAVVFGGGAAVDGPGARHILVSLVDSIAPSLFGSAKLHKRWFPPWRRFLRRRATFDAWVDGLIAQRRATGATGTDILGTLIDARYEDGAPMADEEIRDQLMTLLIAGYETTATAVAWGVYWLLREPAVLARLREDIATLGPAPSVEALVRRPYLEAVVTETLRIEPIVTEVSRVCRVPFRVGPWTVPAGETVVVNCLAILSDERVYPEPRRFRPERFLERSFNAAEFVPFGGGQRRCLGAAFGEAELAITLAAIATGWDLELASREPERAVRRNITMGPKNGVRVRVRRRREGVHPARTETVPRVGSL